MRTARPFRCLPSTFHCLSSTCHCLSLAFHCLSSTFRCLPLAFHCLSSTFRCLPLAFHWPFIDLSLPSIGLSLAFHRPFAAFHRPFAFFNRPFTAFSTPSNTCSTLFSALPKLVRQFSAPLQHLFAIRWAAEVQSSYPAAWAGLLMAAGLGCRYGRSIPPAWSGCTWPVWGPCGLLRRHDFEISAEPPLFDCPRCVPCGVVGHLPTPYNPQQPSQTTLLLTDENSR